MVDVVGGLAVQWGCGQDGRLHVGLEESPVSSTRSTRVADGYLGDCRQETASITVESPPQHEDKIDGISRLRSTFQTHEQKPGRMLYRLCFHASPSCLAAHLFWRLPRCIISYEESRET